MTERAEQIWDSFCAELIEPPTDDMKEALATAVREIGYRFCTDWGELQHPVSLLNEIADELENRTPFTGWDADYV